MEQIISKLREIEVGLAGGRTLGELCRSIDVVKYFLFLEFPRCLGHARFQRLLPLPDRSESTAAITEIDPPAGSTA